MNPMLEEMLWSRCIQDHDALDILFKLDPERYILDGDPFSVFKLFGFLGLKQKGGDYIHEDCNIHIMGKRGESH